MTCCLLAPPANITIDPRVDGRLLTTGLLLMIILIITVWLLLNRGLFQ